MHSVWSCDRNVPVSLIQPGPLRTDMWGDVLDEYDRMIEQLTEEHRQLYASHLAGHGELLGRIQMVAADPKKKVVKAVDHALTSRRPERRSVGHRQPRTKGHRCRHAHRDQRRRPRRGHHVEVRKHRS